MRSKSKWSEIGSTQRRKGDADDKDGDVHVKSTSMYGSLGLLMTGSELGSLDPLDGDNDGLLLGFHNSIKAPATVISSKCVLATTAIGKAMRYGFAAIRILGHNAQIVMPRTWVKVGEISKILGPDPCDVLSTRSHKDDLTMPTTKSPGDLMRLMTESPDDLTLPATGASGLISHESGKDVDAPTKKICRRSARKDNGLPAPSGVYLEMDKFLGMAPVRVG